MLNIARMYCIFFPLIFRYANRAKNIKNKPKINEDPKDAMLREFSDEIKRLKAMLRGEIPVNLEGKVHVLFTS